MKLLVSINGSVFGFFSCGRGVRQGDLLSSLLFYLNEKVLSLEISYVFVVRVAKPIATPMNCDAITHILYVNDVFNFYRGDSNIVMVIISLFERYGVGSSQMVNGDKSLCFLGGPAISIKDVILLNLGFKKVDSFSFI